ncbi:hypothetical protein AYI69_g11131, partial [Smittium culicis]
MKKRDRIAETEKMLKE